MQATDDDKREFESAVSNLLLIMEPSSSCHEALETTSILPSEIVLDEEISSDAEKEDSEMLAVDEFFKNDPSESSISALGIDFADTLETSSTEAFNTQIGVKITKRRLNSDDNIGQRKLGRPFDPIRTSIPRTPKGVKQVPAYFNVGPIDIAQIKKKPQKRESGEDDISCISPNCTYKNKMSELKLHEVRRFYKFKLL